MPDTSGEALAQATSGKQVPRRPGAPREIIYARVELQIEEAVTGEVLYGEPDQPLPLAVGTAYRAWVTLYKVADPAEAFTIAGSARLEFRWQGPAVKVLDAVCDVTPAQFIDGACSIEFLLHVPADAPIATGRILLVYPAGSVRKTQVLLECSISGAHHAAPPDLEQALQVRLSPDRDPRLAFLHIGAQQDELRVRGYHPLVAPLDAVIPQPKLSLADIVDEQPSINIYKKVLEYSRQAVPALLSWLGAVLEKTGNDVSIIVVEHADSRVPWEMLVLKKGGKPLGASAMVTRWTAVKNYADTVWLDPQSPSRHAGRVVKYVDAASLQQSQAENDELLKCAHVSCGSVEDLHKVLRQLPADATFVFVACHGILAKDADHAVELQATPDAPNPSGNITTLSLEDLQPAAHQPVLFVNACHSARLLRTQRGVSGLPEFFLSSFASSFMGTLGVVDEDFAAHVGAQLVREARSKDGVRLPEFLLRLRQQAVQDFDGRSNARRFVSAFMYVFYGSLHSQLQLKSKDGHG